jgi:hypothetical protein
MIIWTKRTLLLTLFLTLIASNVLTLTNTVFNAALSGFMATAIGVRTVSGVLQSKISRQSTLIKKNQTHALKRKAATRKFGTRLVSRTKRVAAKSIAAIPAESIPFIGVAVLIADTGYELYAACETMGDLNQLYSDLGVEAETQNAVLQDVCNPDLPVPGEVWDGVVGKSSEWLERLLDAV